MDVGGFCAEGGPYEIRQECPEGTTALIMGGVWIGLLGLVAAAVGLSRIGRGALFLTLLGWAGLSSRLKPKSALPLAWKRLPSERRLPVFGLLLVGIAVGIYLGELTANAVRVPRPPARSPAQRYRRPPHPPLRAAPSASSTALYGSRATNGVILITTKKGQRNQAATPQSKRRPRKR